MKKTLVYHIYLCDDINTNIAYKINLECLKYYIDIFDKARFVIVMDNLNDLNLRKKGIDWISEIGFTGETDIIFAENTEIGEAATVRDYVVNLDIDKENAVFFSHTKGINNFRDSKTNRESILIWTLVMYFYNLRFANEVVDIFQGKGGPMEAFYGTLLMINNCEHMPIMIPKSHYSGSFYWVNKPFLRKLCDVKKLNNYTFSTRYDAEFYPGYHFNYNTFGAGMKSHNNAAFNLDKMLGAFYNMPNNSWLKVLEILGDKDEFLIFKNEIENKIGFKAYDAL